MPNLTDCSGEQCTKIFNFCENSCINDNREPMGVSLNPQCSNHQPTTIVFSVTQTSTIPCTCTPANSFTETRDYDCPTTTIPGKLATRVQNLLTTTVWNHSAPSTILSTTTKIDRETATFTKTLTPTPCKTTSTKHIETKMNSALQTCTSVQPQSSEVTTEKLDCSPDISTALGALTGILIITLLLVIIGWVWTCWILKKNGGMKIMSVENR